MTILDQAAAIVDRDREQTYGSPAKNLNTIAAFWSAWLRARGLLTPLANLNYEDVACMMVLLKMGRLSNDPTHVDSSVDACGYLYLLEKIRDQENKRNQ